MMSTMRALPPSLLNSTSPLGHFAHYHTLIPYDWYEGEYPRVISYIQHLSTHEQLKLYVSGGGLQLLEHHSPESSQSFIVMKPELKVRLTTLASRTLTRVPHHNTNLFASGCS